MSDRNELVPGTLEMLVLRALVAGPRHGYAIVRRLRQQSDDVLQVEEGSLYPALHRMERRKWIAASWGVSESNRRAKYYRLTAPGKRQLHERVAAWPRRSAPGGRIVSACWAAQRAIPGSSETMPEISCRRSWSSSAQAIKSPPRPARTQRILDSPPMNSPAVPFV